MTFLAAESYKIGCLGKPGLVTVNECQVGHVVLLTIQRQLLRGLGNVRRVHRNISFVNRKLKPMLAVK